MENVARFQKEKKSTKCGRGTRFLCPVQHVCVGKKCLACGNPSCVEAKEKDATETLIKAANSTDQKEAVDMLVFPLINRMAALISIKNFEFKGRRFRRSSRRWKPRRRGKRPKRAEVRCERC